METVSESTKPGPICSCCTWRAATGSAEWKGDDQELCTVCFGKLQEAGEVSFKDWKPK